MDNSTSSALLGVILGGAFTFISGLVPKVVELISENKKHKQSIEKMYFERKLNVLQAYVATLTQLSASYFHNEVSLGITKDLDFFNYKDEFKDLVMKNLETSTLKSTGLVEKLSDLSSASAMFIDLKSDPNSAYEMAKSIHVDISNMDKTIQEVLDVQTQFNLKNEPQKGDAGFELYNEKKRQFKDHIDRIRNNYNKFKEATNETIIEARQDIKNFKV